MTKQRNLKSIILVIPYFGKWPIWINFFMESCRRNPTVNWIFYTDCGVPENIPPNVSINAMSYRDYTQLVSSRLNVNFKPTDPYKLNDIKSMYGVIHRSDISGFDFWGHCDIDMVFGDIRSIYSSDILENYDVISSHEHFVSGHFALFRNNWKIRNFFRFIKHWRSIVEDTRYRNFDESEAGRFFGFPNRPRGVWKFIPRALNPFRRRCLFKEQYSTPFIDITWFDGRKNHPDVWFWRNGIVTNIDDGDRQFLYFHFMAYKHSQFSTREPTVEGKAPWELLDQIVQIDWRLAAAEGFQIGPQGIRALPKN